MNGLRNGSFESDLKEHLLAARVLHFDETGMRCEKKFYWVHIASSQFATLYTMHPKRGQEAMNETGILPEFEGIAVHDHWFPYFAYEHVSQGLYNSHHLRELTFIHEVEQDVRMVKLKQKISGCFRKFHGGQVFRRIRIYISTARKQGWNIWGSLADAIRGYSRLVGAS